MSDIKQIDWAETIAHRMTDALRETGILADGDWQAEQKARMRLADILRRDCLPKPEEQHPPAPDAPKPFKAVYHRYGGIYMTEFSDYEKAREFLQQSANAGELYAHGIYDTIRKVAYYPRRISDPDAYNPEHEEELSEALGLKTPPEVAGLYPDYPDDGEE